VLIDREANATITEFMRRKIRQRVKDPALAEKLIPTNHGFGTRRVPLESGYYEVFNQPNVRLVDVRETPIERITTRPGSRPVRPKHAVDMIIYATGFDAITGAFDRINVRGRGSRRLRDKWAVGAAHLSRSADREVFPNLFTLVGPHKRRHLLQHPALHRAERGLGDRASSRIMGERWHAPRRGHARGGAGVDPARATTPGDACSYTQVDSWMMGNQLQTWPASRSARSSSTRAAPPNSTGGEMRRGRSARGYPGFTFG